jgi:hypothetical protein
MTLTSTFHQSPPAAISQRNSVGGSDGEPIVHSGRLAGFAGHDCDTQS